MIKNKLTTVLSIFIFLFLGSQMLFAHAIWFETPANGTIGKPQTVKLFYGEYETHEIEKTDKWYSDLKELEAYIVHPDQSKTKLVFSDKGDYLETTFTPKSEGIVVIYVKHYTKELGDKTRYGFSSQATVQVGKKVTPKPNLPYELYIAPKSYKKGNKVEATLLREGKALSDQEITIISPQGWTKKLKTNTNGEIIFDVLWSGVYVVEFGEMIQKNGTWYNKPFTETWEGLSSSITIQ